MALRQPRSRAARDSPLRLAIALGGTDWGRSGIGTYVRAVMPLLLRELEAEGDRAIVLGCPHDFAAYDDVLDGAKRATLPEALDKAGPSAAFHLAGAGVAAKVAGANILLLPAANRRMPFASPVPTVAVVHDLAQLHVAEKYDALRMFYLRQVLVRALGHASSLVAVSKATEDDLKEALGRRSPPTRVVPNGVDHARFAPRPANDPSVTAARAHVGIEGPYILYASRLEHPGKNHVRLVHAFARGEARHTHRLVLAGKDWGGGELIRAAVREHALEDRVTFAGFVPDEHLPGLVAGAASVVMVGLREGFGLPALEALAAGRPVCVANAGALPEVAGPLGVLCDPLDVASIAAALDRATLDAAVRARAEREGPGYARERGWERTARDLVAECRRVFRARRERSTSRGRS